MFFRQLDQRKKLGTRNILLDEKNYKDLVIYLTEYIHNTWIKMLNCIMMN